MITVMNTLGVCSSYPTLASSQKRTGALQFRSDGRRSDEPGEEPDTNVLDVNAELVVPTLPEENSDAEPEFDEDLEEGDNEGDDDIGLVDETVSQHRVEGSIRMATYYFMSGYDISAGQFANTCSGMLISGSRGPQVYPCLWAASHY